MEWTSIFPCVTHTQDFEFFDLLHIYWSTRRDTLINDRCLSPISFMRDVLFLCLRGHTG